MIAEICPKANVITIPRDIFEGFDRRRGQMLNSFADRLGLSYDWVIRTDADELICFDPAIYSCFEEVFDTASSKALFALGLNVAEVIYEKVLKAGEMALGHRSKAVFSGHYSKAWASRRGTALWPTSRTKPRLVRSRRSGNWSTRRCPVFLCGPCRWHRVKFRIMRAWCILNWTGTVPIGVRCQHLVASQFTFQVNFRA